jgi:hypothetical protein
MRERSGEATPVNSPAAANPRLTLVKGALKIMAWTKAKTAIVTGAVVLVAAATSPVVIKEMQSHAHSLAAPSPRTTAATENLKGQLLHRGQLVDAGNTTPEAAWETRYWARSKGDYDTVIAGTDQRALAGGTGWIGDKTTFRLRSLHQFASFSGFQILARKDLASDRVELKYQFGFGNSADSQQTKIVLMVEAKGVWRCLQTRPYDVSWDADSQPEPQS